MSISQIVSAFSVLVVVIIAWLLWANSPTDNHPNNERYRSFVKGSDHNLKNLHNETQKKQKKGKIQQIGGPDTPITKLAIVDVGARDKTPPAFLDFLFLSLSNQSAVKLLERSEVDKLLREQALSLSMSNPIDHQVAVKAGNLWAVDAFLMLEATKDEKRKGRSVRMRLVDARYGIRLIDTNLFLEADNTRYPEQAETQTAAIVRKIVDWSQNARKMPLLAVVPFQSKEISNAWDWMGESLSDGIEQNLSLQTGVALLERSKTKTLTDERQLAAGLPDTLKASAVLITGSFKLDRDKEEIVVQMQGRRGGKRVLEETMRGSWSELGSLARKFTASIVERLRKGVKVASMSTEEEVKLLDEQIRGYLLNVEPEKVIPLAEAVLALRPDFVQYRLLLLEAINNRMALRAQSRVGKDRPWPVLIRYCLRATAVAERVRSRAKLSYRFLFCAWMNFIVPLAMEIVANDHTLIEFFVGNLTAFFITRFV